MTRTARTAAVAFVLGTGLLLTACSAETEETATPTPEASETVDETGPVEVPDVTLLILETAQGNLMRSDLEATLVDEAGAPVTADDPTTWIVTAQDPAEGEVERGSTVTLTVKSRG